MDDTTEHTFRTIAQGAIERAESVPCSMADFAAGLSMIAAEVADRARQAADEVGAVEADASRA